MLPLDLHVLSLQLAFILSQDQTLHPIIIYSRFPEGTLFFVCPAPWTASCAPIYWRLTVRLYLPALSLFHEFQPAYCLVCLYFIRSKNSLLKLLKLRLLSLEPCSFPKASAKVELFTIHSKYLNNFFREIFQEITHYSDLQRNKIARFFQPQRPFSRINQWKAQKKPYSAKNKIYKRAEK